VAFTVEKRPAMGSVLEHGSPLKLEPGLMEIGFPTGSYYLISAQDADSIQEIQELALEFSGTATTVKIKPIIPETGDSPLSLAEKKKSDQEQRIKSLKQEVAEHPLINEALRLFGGTITDIRES
jgi:DNA polymerase-3 subunit gamma/tau